MWIQPYILYRLSTVLNSSAQMLQALVLLGFALPVALPQFGLSGYGVCSSVDVWTEFKSAIDCNQPQILFNRSILTCSFFCHWVIHQYRVTLEYNGFGWWVCGCLRVPPSLNLETCLTVLKVGISGTSSISWRSARLTRTTCDTCKFVLFHSADIQLPQLVSRPWLKW